MKRLLIIELQDVAEYSVAAEPPVRRGVSHQSEQV